MTNILIVEDDQALREAYKFTLQREGYNVSTAINGKEALAKTKESEPDIILLDMLMPSMSGLQFLEKYNVINEHPKVKVVVMSNLEKDEQVQKAINLGAYKYITKAHASPKDLCAMVKHLISKNLAKS